MAKPRAGRPSILDEHLDYLHQRLTNGVTNATTLFTEIRARGYSGSFDWSALSPPLHHCHCYELSPTAGQLRRLQREASQRLARLENEATAPDGRK
ncbi:hypothetical protein [Micromonospora sp. HK10]|uniref:hypothetical protein n=1 Tax=Micromonospora sp. HK10 TaxID=1538294 RepID=UPI000626FBC4|nr:hypothetical protein [Micromonospora sp. HK10]KKK04954.1 hypothetical protein LQ51_16275 [Micromonospora sp. HK10]